MIDAHHHLWNYDDQQYPWIPANSALAQNHTIPELLHATTTAGITGTVVVQARQSIEETQWLCSLAAQCPTIRGVVGWLPLADDSIEAHLDEWSSQPALKALRHVLQEEPNEFFQQDSFNRGLAAMAKRNMPYDLLIFEHQISLGIELLDKHPGLPMILDHIAKPVIRNGEISEPWRRGMIAMAQRPNLIGVKISGMLTEVRDAEIDDLTLCRYIDETINIFGTDRVMFGTDWPVCLLRSDTYSQWPDLVRSHLAKLSTTEQNAIYQDNAIRCYRLTKREAPTQ